MVRRALYACAVCSVLPAAIMCGQSGTIAESPADGSSDATRDAPGNSVDALPDQEAGPDATDNVHTSCGTHPPLPPNGGTGAGSTMVPISVGSLTAGLRFGVSVQVGGPTVSAMLDTGSNGLRILSRALADASIEIADAGIDAGDGVVTANYNGGMSLQGYQAFAFVTLGSMTTEHPISIMVVTDVCYPGNSGTECASGDSADASIYGFDSIMGIDLRSDRYDIRSPIAALPGAPAYTIHTDTDGGTFPDAGMLTVGLSTGEFANFEYAYQLPIYADVEGGAPEWNDTTIPMCLRDLTSTQSWCQGAFLDTGDPAPYVETTGLTSSYYLPWGDTAQLIIEGKDGCIFDEYTFNVGGPSTDQVEIRLVDPSKLSVGPYINPSNTVFFRYDVLYDPLRGIVALKRKP